MPRRRRVSKRRTLSPGEQFLAAIEEGLPPSALVRRGPDELDDELSAGDIDLADGRMESGDGHDRDESWITSLSCRDQDQDADRDSVPLGPTEETPDGCSH